MRVLHNLFRHDLQEKELFTMDYEDFLLQNFLAFNILRFNTRISEPLNDFRQICCFQ
jgi:hypothetical protein